MRLKATFSILCLMLILMRTQAGAAISMMVEDFENVASPPTVWVVNIPNENATAQIADDQPYDGKHCLKLHYRFLDTGSYQYLGIPIRVAIPRPVHHLRFWLKGDNSKCAYGVRVSDVSGETHQFSNNSGQGGIIDFSGWRAVAFDLKSGHETWGGDKNGQIDYPITEIAFTIGQPKERATLLPVESDLFFDSLRVDSGESIEETLGGQISVTSPAYCSEIKGNTPINISAPGFNQMIVKCWQQGSALGSNSTVASLNLDTNGNGSCVFPADNYPHGPITVRISGEKGLLKDNCYLQLYNQGGVAWNEGIPTDPPPAAKGMILVFADDFRGTLSISSTDPTATYYDHKPPSGAQDFSRHTFSGHDSLKNPFLQVDSYLRIRASDNTHSSGLISSLKNDASGFTAKVPCYFECRFIGPNAIGTWPAFWVLTDYMTDHVKGIKVPCDELDIIEAYGGEGPHEPNADDSYMITPHCWDQGESGKAIEKQAFDGMRNPIHLRKFGIASTWFETFHIYGCKITETDTIYYCDNIEVGRHATLPLSKRSRFFFLINLATGGGWPVDLSRYSGLTDMYVDYVRVYQQTQ